ncbi:hypothetical protein QZH41_015033 [Actinostola sp. cb2023]|nr:hypothetical protein QZH41_015033 [Actinostola sp. cb2023]
MGGAVILFNGGPIKRILAARRSTNTLDICAKSYYRRFVKNFAEIAATLYKLSTPGKESAFVWSADCERAFDALKGHLVKSPVLAYPRFDLDFVLDLDFACDFGIGAYFPNYKMARRESSLVPAEH